MRLVQAKLPLHVCRRADEPIQLGTLPGYQTEPVAFFTDIPAFKNLNPNPNDPNRPGTIALLWGPGSIHDAHTDHERIHIRDLVRSVDVYKDIVMRLLAR